MDSQVLTNFPSPDKSRVCYPDVQKDALTVDHQGLRIKSRRKACSDKEGEALNSAFILKSLGIRLSLGHNNWHPVAKSFSMFKVELRWLGFLSAS